MLPSLLASGLVWVYFLLCETKIKVEKGVEKRDEVLAKVPLSIRIFIKNSGHIERGNVL